MTAVLWLCNVRGIIAIGSFLYLVLRGRFRKEAAFCFLKRTEIVPDCGGYLRMSFRRPLVLSIIRALRLFEGFWRCFAG